MDAGVVKLIELLVIVAAVFAFGIWQLRDLKKLRNKSDKHSD